MCDSSAAGGEGGTVRGERRGPFGDGGPGHLPSLPPPNAGPDYGDGRTGQRNGNSRGQLQVLVPAIHIQATGREGCCNNRCGMFLSIIFAAIGVVGSLYGFVAAVLGMVKGPQCNFIFLNETSGTTSKQWGRPFDSDLKDFSNDNYLFNKTLWNACESPKGVVEFNIILFSMVLASTAISLILCAVQMFNGLFGCLCGTCGKKD